VVDGKEERQYKDKCDMGVERERAYYIIAPNTKLSDSIIKIKCIEALCFYPRLLL
jgi:hypothetical protein